MQRIVALALVALCALVPVSAHGITTTPSPRPGTPTPLPTPIIPPVDGTTARLRVPDGFVVRLFWSGLNNPRLMTIGPDAQLYVAERGAGAIVRLADVNRDGLADGRTVVASGLNQPHNLEFFQGAVFVAETDKITRLDDRNSDGDYLDTNEKTTITTNLPGSSGHSSKTLRIGPDGKLYVAAGSATNNSVEDDPRRASIMRFNTDGSIPADNPFATDANLQRRPVWAEGLRNSIDFLFTPSGKLWANHNGSDGLGNDTPPEEIVIDVEPGKHYGWPYCYTPALGAVPAGTADVRDARVPLGSFSCANSTPALFTDLGHQAPIGMAQYNASAFPADYRGNLLVAYHGSWNSSVPRECKVQRIVVRNGVPVSSEPFLTGFRDSPTQSCGNAWGRPTGVVVGASGEVFVADGQNGNVYRIVSTNVAPPPQIPPPQIPRITLPFVRGP